MDNLLFILYVITTLMVVGFLPLLEALGGASSGRGAACLADGALAARGLINAEGLAAIGRDPFLRQRYAYDVKRTVETERWVTSWLDAGGSLTD